MNHDIHHLNDERNSSQNSQSGELFVIKQNKRLRCGFTTGSCAAAAAKAGAVMLLSGDLCTEIAIATPKGILVAMQVLEVRRDMNQVTCAVKKDSGDDPDVTNGILIFATVARANHNNIQVDGGQGVGRITKPGLACSIGEPAINPVPRSMIMSEVAKVCAEHGYEGGLEITISVPEGEAIARKTFNPRLGIVGGISILGTIGIVEPMSEKALIDTIRLEMNQQKEKGCRDLLVCPGNYGETFARSTLGLESSLIHCSNYIGEMLDFTVELGFDGLLLIGHAGKLVKLAAGIMNTHSRYADCRMEVIAVHAALHGAGKETVKEIMASLTAPQAVTVLDRHGLRGQVFESIMLKIDEYVNYRLQNKVKAGVILYSNEQGILGKTPQADEIVNKIKRMKPS
ncbi:MULTISPECIES: cobalt-precorrin-5B (C(1))-methyltransferase CbiD [unclassified Dehalobacter]|jgi:cobalamin biosynthesis protein CbiD|uniref:cobalt-precorrin-5B (C(1))-methyltransferase CbiD n=1 Tax=unclassified Dehalobacter TaxID=2635733 RepID=UPI00028B3A2E|nr:MULTISPECIES: cobalt-precorrin-5B (C(1))-methyltransferase CbiD [unclassified Dehalobacter]AFV03966.1 Cobalt-precorrin-6 synthase, anaerobic, CbiD [Dehalobacter sp. DCA]AFV06946.1 Cobalt-precorrin-6 synthase, anaerobic, CbiD [Dehalobacter sp. CF]